VGSDHVERKTSIGQPLPEAPEVVGRVVLDH
jgi:hypothetical protein